MEALGSLSVRLRSVLNMPGLCLDVLNYLWDSRGGSFGEAFPGQARGPVVRSPGHTRALNSLISYFNVLFEQHYNNASLFETAMCQIVLFIW